MGIVSLTACGVGGATILGGMLGFVFKSTNRDVHNVLVSFAAGVMLSAAIVGLILPGMNGPAGQMFFTLLGVGLGTVCLSLVHRFLPELSIYARKSFSDDNEAFNRALLFVAAIAIHNFPEGLAAGVGFGCERQRDALLIAGGIALQNLPEGMIIIAPMLAAGISPLRTFCCAAFTGLLEIFGTYVGFAIIHTCDWVLPYALGFAGGTMLYIICEEMIPDSHQNGTNHIPTYAFIIGFCVVLISNHFLE